MQRSAHLGLAALVICAPIALRARAGQDPAPIEAAPEARVALLGRPFALEPELARDLAPARRERVWLVARGANDPDVGPDPLQASEAPLARFEIDPDAPAASEERAVAERIEHSRCIALSGGTWLAWNAILRPHGKLSRAGAALVAAHRSGAVVLAAGGAATFLVRWSPVARTELGRELRNPHEESPDLLVQGLEFVRDVALDVESAAGPGRAGRASPDALMSGLSRGGVDLGLWLAGDVAWIEGPRREVRIAGSGQAIVFDLSNATRSRHDLRQGRLSLLRAGARWDGRARQVLDDRASGPDTRAGSANPGQATADQVVPDVLAPALLNTWMAGDWGQKDRNDVVFRDEKRRLRLHLDERSVRVAGAWTSVAFDLARSLPE